MAERSVNIRLAVRDVEAARARLRAFGGEGKVALHQIEVGAEEAHEALVRLDTHAGRGSGIRSLRLTAQQLSFQIQDVVVQLSAGTSAAQVFTQQFPQIASAFGPAGAVVGVFGAIVGAATMALFGLRDAADAAKDAQEALKDITVENRGEVEKLAESIHLLNEEQRRLQENQARSTLRQATADLKAQLEIIDDVAESTQDIVDLQLSLERLAVASSTAIGQQAQVQLESIRLSEETLLRLADVARSLSAGFLEPSDAARVLNELAEASGDKRIVELADKLNASAKQADNLENQIDISNDVLKIFADETGDAAEELKGFDEEAAKVARTLADIEFEVSTAGIKAAKDEVKTFEDDLKKAKKAQAEAARKLGETLGAVEFEASMQPIKYAKEEVDRLDAALKSAQREAENLAERRRDRLSDLEQTVAAQTKLAELAKQELVQQLTFRVEGGTEPAEIADLSRDKFREFLEDALGTPVTSNPDGTFSTQETLKIELSQQIEAVAEFITQESAYAKALREANTELMVQQEFLKLGINESDAAAANIRRLIEEESLLEATYKATNKAVDEQGGIIDKSAEAAKDAADSLDKIIEEQALLLKFQGEETEEYRVQLRLLELKRDKIDVTPELERQVRILERQATQLEEMTKVQDLFNLSYEESIESMASNIQTLMADTWEEIFRGGIDSFNELATAVEDIFIRLAAEIASIMTIRAILGGIGGGLGGAAGGVAAAGGPNLIQSLFGGGAASAIIPAGWMGGLSGGAPAYGTPQIAGWSQGLIGGPAAMAPLPWYRTPVAGTSLLAGTALGFGGGYLIGSQFGGAGGLGGGFGGAAGAYLGAPFGPLGMVAGGAIGGLAGGFLGSLFGGGGGQTNKISPQGGLGAVGLTASGAGGQFVRQLDQQLVGLLTTRQEQLVDAALRAAPATSAQYSKQPSAGDLSRLAAGRIGPAATALGFNAAAIAGPRAQFTPEQQLQNLQTALDIFKQMEEFRIGPVATQFRDLNEKFQQMGDEAFRLGVSTDGLSEAWHRAGEALGQEIQLQKNAVLESTGTWDPLYRALNDLDIQMAQLRTRAQELDLPLENIARAHELAAQEIIQQDRLRRHASLEMVGLWDPLTRALHDLEANMRLAAIEAERLGYSTAYVAREQARLADEIVRQYEAQLDALALSIVEPFDRMLEPLRDLQNELTFTLQNPANQMRQAREDFERVAQQAAAGDLQAIEQFADASRFFIEQAGRFGASPGQVQAILDVQQATNNLIGDIERERSKAEASVPEEIRRASERQIDKMGELQAAVEIVAEEVRRLGRRP